MRALVLILALLASGSCSDPDDPPTADPLPSEVSEAVEAAAPGQTPESETATVAAPEPEAEQPVAEVKSREQLDCEKRGGRFVPVSRGSAFRICLIPTRDFTRQCSSGRDCEGVCLARSRTCAPVVPLLGCNEVLLEGGSTAVDCIR